MGGLSVLVLGVAGGAGFVYERACSSSFLIFEDGKPLCLVDIGFGVTWEAIQHVGALPRTLIVTHNHSDHAGELPPVLLVERGKGRMLTILSAPEIEARLKSHRLAEHAKLFPPETLADWVHPNETGQSDLSERFAVRFIAGEHSAPCYGFTLHDRETGEALIGYTSDSAVCEPLYEAVSAARLSIFDARVTGNPYHASFDDVASWLGPNSYIIGHGFTDRAQVPEKYCELPLLWPGDRLAVV